MQKLRQLQENFACALTSDSEPAFLTEIHPHRTVPPIVQLLIYRDSITGRLQKTLKTIYAVTYQLVGQDFFMAMVNVYIRQTPSHSFDINHYGHTLPDFIDSFAPAASLPYLADVARLEWACHQVSCAPNCEPFDYQGLANSYAGHGDEIIFQLPPRSALIESAYPIDSIWEVNQPDASHDTTITLEPDHTHYLFIWQQDYTLHIDTLTHSEFQILNWISKNLPLAELTTLVTSTFPEVDLPALLSNWVTTGWFVGFLFPTSQPLP